MGFSRTWNVPDEFWILWWRSREHRQLIIDVLVEPASKGPAGKRSAPEFQRQVMDQMEQYRRYPMRGPVALDLHFRAARRNPPSIQRAVKHTLDLLGPALPGTERPRRRSVLYRDDRQVKFLYADLDQEWSREGSDGTSAGRLFMVARRANDVAADLCMAARLHRDCQDDEDDEESPFWSPDIPEEPEPGWPLDPGSARTPVEQYLADSLRFHHVMDVQRGDPCTDRCDPDLGAWQLPRSTGAAASLLRNSRPSWRSRGRRPATCSCWTRSRSRCPACHGRRDNRRRSSG